MKKILKGFLVASVLGGTLAVPSFAQDVEHTFQVLIRYHHHDLRPGYIVEAADHSAKLYSENSELLDTMKFVEMGTYSDKSPATFTRFSGEKFNATVHNELGTGSALFREKPHLRIN